MQVEILDVSPSGDLVKVAIANVVTAFDVLEWGGEDGEKPLRWKEHADGKARSKRFGSRDEGYRGTLDVLIDHDVIKHVLGVALDRRSEYLIEQLHKAGDAPSLARANRIAKRLKQRRNKRSARARRRDRQSRPVHRDQLTLGL